MLNKECHPFDLKKKNWGFKKEKRLINKFNY